MARSISEPLTDEPRDNAAERVFHRPARIGKDQLRIEVIGKTHAGAILTGALLAIERKQPRVEGLIADAAAETKKPLVENLLAAFRNQMNDAVAQAQTLIDHRFDFMAAGLGLADDDIDVVFFEARQAARQLGRAQVGELAVDAGAPVAKLDRAR